MRLNLRPRGPAAARLLALTGLKPCPGIGAPFADLLATARLCALTEEAAAELGRRAEGSTARLSTPGGLGPRAEAAAVATLLKVLDAVDANTGVGAQTLASLRTAACDAAAAAAPPPRLALPPEEETGGGGGGGGGPPSTSPSPEAAMAAWAASAGITSSIRPAFFEGGGGCARGAAASQLITPGAPILTLPLSALISPAAAARSDLGRVLFALPALAPDAALLAWTMVDAADPASPWAPVWGALKAAPIATGLGVAERAAGLLQGTPLGVPAAAARAHVRAAYEAAAPLWAALRSAVRDPGDLSYASYLWAVQVWYAFAIEVETETETGGESSPPSTSSPPPPPPPPAGGRGGGGQAGGAPPSTTTTTTPALAPLAFLLNHSAAHPHAVRYGALEAEDSGSGGRVMRIRACAPAAAGQEVTLSYGPKPNADLLLFYGFALADNPDDAVEVRLEVKEGEAEAMRSLRAAAAGSAGLGAFPVAALPALDFLPLAALPPPGPGPTLVATARLAVASEEELTAIVAGQGCVWSGEGVSAATQAAAAGAVAAVATAAADDFAAAAARARGFNAESAEEQAWVESLVAYCEGGERIGRAAAAAAAAMEGL